MLVELWTVILTYLGNLLENSLLVNLTTIRGSFADWIIKPLTPILKKSRLKPNILTLTGLALGGVAAVIIATNHLLLGGFLVLFSGLFDLLDGALARLTKQATFFGALLDSTADRISEAVLFFGLLFLLVKEALIMEVFLVFLALVGSFLTSYIRARAEGLGIDCQVGLFGRAERVIVLALGLVFNQILIALIVLVIISFTTVGQRLLYVWQQNHKVK